MARGVRFRRGRLHPGSGKGAGVRSSVCCQAAVLHSLRGRRMKSGIHRAVGCDWGQVFTRLTRSRTYSQPREDLTPSSNVSYGDRYSIPVGGDRHQPQGLPGQEYDESSSERQYNIFRWYRAGWARYTSPDPVGGRFAANLYFYAAARPVTKIDRLGLFEVDANCSGCGPSNMAPTLGASIRRQTTEACGSIDDTLTDVALADCVKGKCRTARITCVDPTGQCGRQPLSGGHAPYAGNEITLCPDNWLPIWGGIIGDMVIHEFAHLCNWCHGDPGGVPAPGKPDGTCWRDWPGWRGE